MEETFPTSPPLRTFSEQLTSPLFERSTQCLPSGHWDTFPNLNITSDNLNRTAIVHAISRASHDDLIQAGNKDYTQLYNAYVKAEAEYRSLKEAYTVLATAIPQVFTHIPTSSNPLGFQAPSDTTLLVSASPVSPTIQLDSTKFPNVQYWSRRDWEESKARKDAVSANPEQDTSERNNGRASRGENVTMQFVQHENGDVIDGHRASDIRKHAREIFAHLLRMGTAPKVWGEVGLVAATYYRSEMYRQFPELRLCEQNWKVNMIATDTYSQWYRKHGPGGGGTKIVKEEDNEPETPKACGTSIAVKRESPCAGDSSEVNSMKKMKIEQAATTATVEEPSLAVASDVYVNPATFTTTSESPLSAADNSESTSMQPIAPVAAPSNADGGTTNTAVLLVNPLADLFGTPAANVGGSIISRLSHNGDAAAAAAVAAPVGCNNTPAGDGAKRSSKKSGPAKPMQLSQSTTPRNLYKCDYLKDHPNATTAEFTTVWNSLDKATKLAYKEKSVALEKLKIKSTTTVTSG